MTRIFAKDTVDKEARMTHILAFWNMTHILAFWNAFCALN
jgi:hypothetical protein